MSTKSLSTQILASLIVVSITLLVFGCSGGGGSTENPIAVPDGTKVLVANSLAETITTVSFQGGSYVVKNNIASTGQAPNQVIIKGSIVYVLNSLSNSVLALDASNFNLIYEASVGLGKSPYNMAFINNDEVIITNWQGNDCVRMNLNPAFKNERIIATIPLLSSSALPKDKGIKETASCPQAVVVIGDSAFVTIANLETQKFAAGGPGFIALIDLKSNKLIGTLQTTGRNTGGLCHDPYQPNRLYILSAGDINTSTWMYDGNGVIDVLDINTYGIVKSFPVVAAPAEMVVAPSGIAYITDLMEGRIFTLNTQQNYLGGVIEIAQQGNMSFVSGLSLLGSSFLFVLEFNQDELVIIDLASGNKILDRIKVGDGPDALAFY